jgi:uncharacterized protein (TIGR02246 family)
MTPGRAVLTALVALVALAAPARADELRAAMEADNARWLAAFNTPDPAAWTAMYTRDAILLPDTAQPITGPEAIRQFFEGFIKAGVKEHTFEILSTRQEGNLAYQVARWTVVVVKDTGERTPLSGNTVRIFERQSDGSWLTKVHMYNEHARPGG